MPPPPLDPIRNSAVVQRAVEMRLAGCTLQQIRNATGLSAPTVIGAYKRFLSAGWGGVAPAPRGRRPGQGRALSPGDEAALQQAATTSLPASHGLPDTLWTAAAMASLAQTRGARAPGARTLAAWLRRCGLLLPSMADQARQRPDLAQWRDACMPALARQARQQPAQLVWVGQISLRPAGTRQRLLVAQTLRGSLAWMPLAPDAAHCITTYTDFLDRLVSTWPGAHHILLHGVPPAHPALQHWQGRHPTQRLVACPAGPAMAASPQTPSAAAARAASPPPPQ